MMTTPRIFAIVPAAGQSQRMGRDKQLLDVGGRPMLAAVVESLTAAGVNHVVVVTRTVIASQMAGLLAPDTIVAYNDDAATEMIDSIRIGLKTWATREHIEANDGILLVPGDQPGIAAACIKQCVERFSGDPGGVVVAAYQGRRGHPLIFPGSLIAFVESPSCDSGLRQLAITHTDRVRVVECDSPAVVRDIDSPADYDERSK
jgi:molybdenum cofactor cytidylyltransferase